ncbi:hypothetical protein COHA_003314 [Chlorella ohadii]|uniref:UspA domain-containing protein n=1 Tax=Chlorella ohadii TaxID=2649997 RepID=A0AAD5DV96_9CHLO|nr:hypothetical protein COHA_003314 [Chlorella ohadii]
MRLVLLSIEFNAGTFSGNGVYACSQARALTQLGHEVLVVAGAPPCHAPAAGSTGPGHEAPPLAAQILHIELPTWGRLDAACAWRDFAAGACRPDVAAAVAAFGPTAILGVDWHSVAAYDALVEALARHNGSGSSSSGSGSSAGSGIAAAAPPYVFLNYRVYHRTASADELAVIEAQEERALRLSAASLVLCRADADYLRRHFAAATDPATGAAPLHVLLPALRADMDALPPPPDVVAQPAAGQDAECCGKHAGVAVLAVDCTGAATATAAATAHDQQTAQAPQQQQAQQAGQVVQALTLPISQQAQQAGRRFLTCCVRISPEKEPHRFVEAVEELQRRGSLQRLGVTPLMAGAGWASEYGAALRERLEAAVPQCVIHDSFLGPAELAAVYAATVLNVHPPTYDAYGMTVVEAASQGAPTLVQGGGHVGATDLLCADSGEVLCCDMDQPADKLADILEALLADRAGLAAVGRKAMAKARSWTEHDNAGALTEADPKELESSKELLHASKERLVSLGVNGSKIDTSIVVASAGDSRSIGREISNYAEDCGCETVVMGSRGLGITKRALFNLLAVGSVSDYVVHHSKCNVVIHKDPSAVKAAAGSSSE